MIEAVRNAVGDAEAPGLPGRIDSVRAMKGVWGYRNPALAVIEALDLHGAETGLSVVGRQPSPGGLQPERARHPDRAPRSRRALRGGVRPDHGTGGQDGPGPGLARRRRPAQAAGRALWRHSLDPARDGDGLRHPAGGPVLLPVRDRPPAPERRGSRRSPGSDRGALGRLQPRRAGQPQRLDQASSDCCRNRRRFAREPRRDLSLHQADEREHARRHGGRAGALLARCRAGTGRATPRR